MAEELKLADAVASKFELVGTKAGKFNFATYGLIDLCALNEKDCIALINAGFPYLKKKAKEKPPLPITKPKKRS